MKEYRVIQTFGYPHTIETTLNDHARDGFRLAAVTDTAVILERERINRTNDQETPIDK